jgi:hypothetical protein
MKMENCIRAIAGTFILASLILAFVVSGYFLYFTAFVGINLFQSAFTGFCPMEKILHNLALCRG